MPPMSKIKFVYALVSGEKDYYTEQALMSMYSLRLHNPDSHIVLATDGKTAESLSGKRATIRNYVSELVEIDTPEDFNPVQRSRFVKTAVRQYVRGDFLYLDCDTIILGNMDELSDFDGDAAATPYMHIKSWSEGSIPERLEEYHKMIGVPPEEYNYTFFCNGGVILCKDNEKGRLLFDLWHKFWQEASVGYGYHSDQCSLWRANAAAGNVMVELDGIYNCQMIHPQWGTEYISGCKVFHYHATALNFTKAIPFKDPVFLEKIRRDGITPEVDDITRNVMRNYLKNVIIVGGEALEIYNSPMVILARKLSRDYPWTNKLAKFIYGIFGYRL